MLVWTHGTVGVADHCATSWAGTGKLFPAYIARWLQAGYAVVSSDYEGLGTPGLHPYLVGATEARNALDSARAVIGQTYHIANRVLIDGQSQGGGAAFATAGVAPSYAPELAVLGTIATGVPYITPKTMAAPPADPNAVDPAIAYMFYVTLVARSLDPSLDTASLFTARALPVFEKAVSSCIDDLARGVKAAGLSDANALRPGAMSRVLKVVMPYYGYSTLALKQPLFVGTGDADRDVSPLAQTMLVHDACAAGTVVERHVYPGKSHLDAWMASEDDAFAFGQAVMHGGKIHSTCP
ncbi:lipase family protein [Gluconacetobacter sacchari]|uniref:Secretory lipase n=1 Tax=Gluconacetobacter sacchari DSM 12717 TaxID=1307940 RepID=A0ABQ0P3C9_9PROT|nr:lipase family protein [Gluconacetobacter sacchari]GBQ20733.1 hypothetical protein AA12717_0660 [Gluconacetobacter sacchari DSM 12717]